MKTPFSPTIRKGIFNYPIAIKLTDKASQHLVNTSHKYCLHPAWNSIQNFNATPDIYENNDLLIYNDHRSNAI